MSRNRSPSTKMVSTKSKHKVISCSTPEYKVESPSRDSDSLCDSEAASPVPFLCTQDGAEGETDVVWNFYTPKADHTGSRFKNTTPLSRRAKKSVKPRLPEKLPPKRRLPKPSQKKTELFQDLIELNQNLHELIAKKSKNNVATEKNTSGSEDDIFHQSGDCSPKSVFRTNSRCLRRNVLSSKFSKPDPEAALESDDSMNECLIKASQIIEENILTGPTPAKRTCINTETSAIDIKPTRIFNAQQDSMDSIFSNIKLESPLINKTKKYESPHLNNDSFDSLVGNLDDSALERLTQMPVKNTPTRRKHMDNDWTIKEVTLHDGSPTSKSFFGRHSSMPESPSVSHENKPSTSGMAFGRYNSMPYDQNRTVTGDSPIRCTPDEIKRKHQQAREKLLAKRLLPFTATQQSSQASLPTQTTKKTQFQPKIPSSSATKAHNTIHDSVKNETPNNNKSTGSKTQVQQSSVTNYQTQTHQQANPEDLRSLIERKRQEALMKLRKRQPQLKKL